MSLKPMLKQMGTNSGANNTRGTSSFYHGNNKLGRNEYQNREMKPIPAVEEACAANEQINTIIDA